MERETKKFTTTSGKEVEIKTYLTKGERDLLRNILAEGRNVALKGEDQEETIPMTTMMKYQDESVKIAVVSFEGSSENVFERIQNSRAEDYDEILAETEKMQKGNLIAAK